MTDYLRTLFRLAEATYSDYTDEEEAEQARLDDRQWQQNQRNEKLEKDLRDSLHRMGVSLYDGDLNLYVDDANNEISFKIDDSLDLRQIQALASLGTEIKIAAQAEEGGHPYLAVSVTPHKGLAIR
jgi:hypothetical protein